MYQPVKFWRAQAVPRVARPLPRGMGAAAACNWTDDFGNCITPGAGDTIVTPGGLRINVGGAAGSASPGGLSQWLNENGKWVAIAAAAFIGLKVIGGR